MPQKLITRLSETDVLVYDARLSISKAIIRKIVINIIQLYDNVYLPYCFLLLVKPLHLTLFQIPLSIFFIQSEKSIQKLLHITLDV